MPQKRDRSIFARLLVLLVALALVAAACGGGDDNDDDDASGENEGNGAEQTGGTLVDLQNFAYGEPDHIDPGLAGVLQGAQIGQLLFDGLTEVDFSDRENPELMPQVAESWETPDEGKTWVFQIAEGQEFSDGTPVLPSNFANAWNLHASAEYASEIAYFFDKVEGGPEVQEGTADTMSGVVADDEAMTLTVTLAEPVAEFPTVVSHPVYSPKTDEGVAAGADYENDVMIGNGPFVMDGPWEREERIVLARNDNWKGGIYGEGELAVLDSIEFRISRDIDSAYADFEAGNGHTAAIPSGRFAEATDNYENATDSSLGIYHFFVNMEDPQVGGEENRLLRQAISLAIDREAVNDAAFDGSRRVADGITPPGIPGYEEGLCEYCEYDPDRAQELFDEWAAAGGTLDGPINMQFNSGSGHEDVVAIIQANLRDNLGIEVSLDGRDPTTYFSVMRQGECVICRAGWIWDYPTYDSAAYSLLHSSTIDGDNIGRYSNPEVDRLLTEARSTIDDDERASLYVEAERLALEDLPVIPIVWYAGAIVYSDDVENFVYTPGQFVLYERVSLNS